MQKEVFSAVVLIYFGRPPHFRLWIQRYVQISLFIKGFETSFLRMIFQEKSFPCFILLTDRISFSGYLYFLRYWTIYELLLFCFPACDVISFEIKFSFLIKPFFYITKKSEQKYKYLKKKKSFKHKIKSIFIIFKGFLFLTEVNKSNFFGR